MFHLAQRDPERWEQERETALLESLREAREGVNTLEREAGTSKELLEHSQRQASVIIIYEDELPAHKTWKKRPTACRRNWWLLSSVWYILYTTWIL